MLNADLTGNQPPDIIDISQMSLEDLIAAGVAEAKEAYVKTVFSCISERFFSVRMLISLDAPALMNGTENCMPSCRLSESLH